MSIQAVEIPTRETLRRHPYQPARARIAGIFLVAALFGGSAFPAAADGPPAPMLVGDYSPGTRPTYFDPDRITPARGQLYLSGSDDQHGKEPWVTDGTAAGTRRLADLCPGTCPSYPIQFTELGERVIFYSISLNRLYAIENSSAIENETVHQLAGDLEQVGNFVRHGSLLYFYAKHDGQDQNWVTDGTAAGTRPTDVFCIDGSCGVADVVVLNGTLYFTRPGRLYTFAGDGEVTRLALIGGSASLFQALDANLFFFNVCAASQQCDLWVSDGTAAGTRSLEPAPGTSLTRNARYFLPWRGRMYFANGAGQLVSSDGSAAGTRVEPVTSGTHPRPRSASSRALLYTAEIETPDILKTILVARDGAGTEVQLAGPFYDLWLNGRAPQLGEKMFFASYDRLLVTDGSPQGTLDLGPISGSDYGANYGGDYYLGLDRNGLSALWRSDGTLAGTVLADLGLRTPNSTYLTPHLLGSRLLLEQSYQYDPLEPTLFWLDPQTFSRTPADARRLHILAAGPTRAFARGYDDDPELVAIGEDRVEDLPAEYVYETALASDDHLFFTDARPGQELLESSGTAAGTRLLFDQLPGYVPTCSGHHCEPTFPIEITPSGDNVFFTGPTADHQGHAFWAYRRGQPAPIELIRKDSTFGSLVAVSGGRGVFGASRTVGQYLPQSLWLTDGSPAGTRPYFDLPGGAIPHLWAATAQGAYFALGYPATLWVTDFSAAGTVKLLSTPATELHQLVAAGNRLFFTGSPGPGEGRELGFSDGTAAGTRWLDLLPGPEGSLPENLFPLADGRLVFAAAADAAGYELWISDGTRAGSRRLTDLAPGAAASSPHEFAQVGQRLFFQADDGIIGNELWALDLPPARPPCPEGHSCLQGGRFDIAVTAHTADGDFPGRKASGNADSAVFSFFSADNWEMLVKVLDGCAINQNFWVFAASATDVGFTLTVTDRETAAEKTYTNRFGHPAQAITDSTAFSCTSWLE